MAARPATSTELLAYHRQCNGTVHGFVNGVVVVVLDNETGKVIKETALASTAIDNGSTEGAAVRRVKGRIFLYVPESAVDKLCKVDKEFLAKQVDASKRLIDKCLGKEDESPRLSGAPRNRMDLLRTAKQKQKAGICRGNVSFKL